MSKKVFEEVFCKMKLSKNIKNAFSSFFVEEIVISKELKKIQIVFFSDEIVYEECLEDFKKDIKNNFPSLNDVEVILKYNTKNNDIKYNINKYWNNILFYIKSISPICFTILKDTNWEVNNDDLIINLTSSSAFLFKNYCIDSFIKKILKERFNYNLNVKFISNKNIIDLEKRERIKAEILLENSENTDNFIPKISLGNTSNNKFNRLKRVNLKVKEIKENSKPIKGSINDGENIIIEGKILEISSIDTRNGKRILKVDITDLTDSISFKFFTTPDLYEENYKDIIKEKKYVKVKGKVIYDDFVKELIIMANEICEVQAPSMKMDNAEEKRVELHLHTQMSSMDAVTPVKDYIKRAHDWGHKAIAITDHGVVQSYPDAMEASRKLNLKIIYGVEAYIVDDLINVVNSCKNQDLDTEFVIFDLETTGLNREVNKIIEIGAVKIRNGEIIDRFSTFVNPQEKLSEKIIEITKITDEMLCDAPTENDILPQFFDFFKNSVLVAHNANFDVGFIKKWASRNNYEFNNTFLDTVLLARTLFPEMTRVTLDSLVKKLSITLKNHHRAVDDAEATSQIFLKFYEMLKYEYNITDLNGINSLARTNIDVKKLKPSHAIILVKNQKGLRNLYELISDAHLKYYFRNPLIPKSEFLKLRDGLIIGTACSDGEFYKAILNDAEETEIEKLADFYDYLEIQPLLNNSYLINSEKISNINSFEDLKKINKKIVFYGEKYNKKVVATCDVHFLDPEDEYYRRIIQDSKGYSDCDNQPPVYFKTTDEMLDEFQYLGQDKAKEVVINNTNYIADMIEKVLPIPDKTFTPKIDGADDELRKITTDKAREIYGEILPEIVEKRLERELNSIISNGFAVLYIIAQKIVWDSVAHGYIVGSRGSVGSSFVATMAGITEVNPLAPHYICKSCKYSDFDSEDVVKNAGNSGWDLPDKECPNCEKMLYKDGHDIPFETFLGFDGDKEPDIDLNFSGEYQQNAHRYTEELFGSGHVFKAGTIGTLADKTVFGYVMKYMERRNLRLSSAEVNRLKIGCVGIKRTTGQHPGGLMVVPKDKSIYDFSPIQRPANDVNSNVITTHFDYHSISGRILKLDLLGHDVPTILHMFYEVTGFDPLDVPMDDKGTMSLFESPEILGVTSKDIDCPTGTLGIPEFGTSFTIQMLADTRPTTFSELVRISGLSHGTDVWINNAQDLIKNEIATLKDVIPTRDDIMVYLIIKGVENLEAFTIMESVRKGKGLTKAQEELMINHNVPNWYIDSCKKIKYMFPKGHAVAYVTNAFRIGYFKINYPYAFYSALFSVKFEYFDYGTMCFGIEKILKEILLIQEKGKDVTAKEKNKLTIFELVREFYCRGLKFIPMDIYKSDAVKFKVLEEGLLPPLCTVQGLGENAGISIVEAREDGEFDTIEDLVNRTKVNKSTIDLLKQCNVLNGLPENNQLTLF